MLAPTYIALGANQGNRLLALRKARHFLASYNHGQLPTASAIYESEPIGPSENPYLNAVCMLSHCTTPPFELLEGLKTYEKAQGRKLDAQRWSSRPIDLDIILMGQLVMQSAHLEIPHPRWKERSFVLVPLLSLKAEIYGYEKREKLKQLLSSLPHMQLERSTLSW